MLSNQADSLKRQNNITPIGEAIAGFLKQFGLEQKYNETRIICEWSEIAGHFLASRTKKIFIRYDKLYLELSSAPLRHDALMYQTELLGRIKAHLNGYEVVKEIVFI